MAAVGAKAVGLPAEELAAPVPDSDGVRLAAVDGLADAAPDGSSPSAGPPTSGAAGVAAISRPA
ncbi:hypothetical protein OG542_14410 [Streptomyces violaceus]|uniref:hypothetical protein n=1 Tax=Streptomyces violaceus TaxID=1936 RepID=UPI002E22FFAD